MQNIYIYAGVFGLIFGIFARSVLSFALPEILLLAVLSLALLLVGRRGANASSAPFVLCVSLFLFLFACGALRMEWASWSESNPAFEARLGTEEQFEGIIVREVEEKERTVHAYVEIEGEIVLVIADRGVPLSYGEVVQVTGVLKRPETFATELGRTFNYPGYLQARGVHYVLPYAEVQVVDHEKGNLLFRHLLQFKQRFIHSIEMVLQEPHAGLSVGLLLGVKQSLGELEDVFRTAGITHIVVLSGYNIMLVVLFVTYVLSFLLPWRLRLVCGLVAIALFACMVGLSATVLRASIMAGLILVAKLFGRTYAVVRALMLTGCLMLVFNPYLLVFDVGFQLSFIATLGLILFAPHLERYVEFMPKALGLREFLTATVATQLFVLPILLYQIGEFSAVAVIVNLLVLPMVPVAMLLTFATGMIGLVSVPLAQVCGYLAYASLWYIIEVARFFAGLPFASFTFPPFSFVLVVAAYGALGFVLYLLHTRVNVPEDLRGWTIVAEEDLTGEKNAPQQTPLFFR